MANMKRIVEVATPSRKVQAGGAGGALGIIVAWLLGAVWGLDVPAEVGAALSTFLGIILSWVVPD